ncbi:MAG TPA: AMP-binding protein, partial [Rhodocyclaceae bacterium]|nr:AMP-binding protein [Rhodocyclaceae bacterium]
MPSSYFDPPIRHWRQLCGEFRWNIPDKFNIAHACCGRWANDRSRFALYAVDNENCRAWSFWDIQQAANRLSNALAAMTVMAGDNVAIVMGQRAETAIAHIACHQMGALTLPLSPSIGAEELAERLQRTPVRIVVIDEDALPALESIGPASYAKYVIGVGAARASCLRRWDDLLPLASSNYTALATNAAVPAIVGAQGDLLPQRSLLAQLPGFVCAHEFYPQNADLFWSPRAWTAPGLFGGILSTWNFGQPVLAYRGPLDAERAYRLMDRYGVRNLHLDEDMLTA